MNRTQADSIGLKLKLVNCDILPWYDYGADEFTFLPLEVETLAEMEHDRWIKQKLSQGWKYGAQRDDVRRLHPMLIDWDDPALPEEEKEKDRNAIRQIPRCLALAGYQIYRLNE
jgi:hypothetical protein